MFLFILPYKDLNIIPSVAGARYIIGPSVWYSRSRLVEMTGNPVNMKCMWFDLSHCKQVFSQEDTISLCFFWNLLFFHLRYWSPWDMFYRVFLDHLRSSSRHCTCTWCHWNKGRRLVRSCQGRFMCLRNKYDVLMLTHETYEFILWFYILASRSRFVLVSFLKIVTLIQCVL
jgi:hypothetical protein